MEIIAKENLVVSSRVRLARNLEGLPFKTTQKGAFDALADTIVQNNRGFKRVSTNMLSNEMAQGLFEQHLISREFLENKSNGIIVTSEDNKAVIMLGEEDHVRIQSIQIGFDLDKAHNLAKKISNDLSNEHKIAWRGDFGFLTSCPTNIGAGMRASVMLFLPALTITGQINAIAGQLSNQHITVRGVYGEGSSAGGYMYQISNQACFGKTEAQIMNMVKGVVEQIIVLEQKAQMGIYKRDPDAIIDGVLRAWGILTNAYMISSAEAVDHLAMLKLGSCLGILQFKNPHILDDLFFLIQPNTIVSADNRATAILERDKIRARRVAEKLGQNRVK